jgi:hypothetical protein
MSGRHASADPRSVEQQPVAEILPGLYRAVLDAVGSLEALGLRRDAARIRQEAIDTYSQAWNRGAARRLQVLRARAERAAAGRRRALAVESDGRERAIGVGRTTV